MAKVKKRKRGRPKRNVNKAQAIKDYLAQNPDAAPKAVVSGLKKRGIAVTTAYVSNVKAQSRWKKAPKVSKRKKVVRRKRVSPRLPHAADRHEAFVRAVEFIQLSNGFENARRLIDDAERIFNQLK